MLTPQQIKDYEFRASGRKGYEAADVDKFFAELTIDYEKMFRENAELIKKVSLLADKLEQYKNNEDNTNNAAKSRAGLIDNVVEKSAVADTELISIINNKVQEIMRKEKDDIADAGLAAKSSESNKTDAATRNITSETLYFDMLKKEVAEFKANILLQYKAHIELLSKLPELAEKKAKEINVFDERADSEDETVEYIAPFQEDEEVSEQVDEIILEDNVVEESKNFDDIAKESLAFNEEENDDEKVIKTTLPYDFFDDKGSNLEFVDSNEVQGNIEEKSAENAENVKKSEFSVDVDFNFNFDDLYEASFYDEKDSEESAEITEEHTEAFEVKEDFDIPVNGFNDIPITKGFSIDKNVVEKLDEEEISEEDNKKKHRGFFKRKK